MNTLDLQYRLAAPNNKFIILVIILSMALHAAFLFGNSKSEVFGDYKPVEQNNRNISISFKSAPVAKKQKPKIVNTAPVIKRPTITQPVQGGIISQPNIESKPSSNITEQPIKKPVSSNNGNSRRHKAKLRSWLEKYKRYPSRLKRAGVEGRNIINIVISPSGNLLSKRLVKSSGNIKLDKATLAMASRAAPFPKAPAGFGNISITVPIDYFTR